MNEDTEILCKCCGRPLEWEDTIDTLVGNGTYTERQVWNCPHCEKEYGIDQEYTLANRKITSFEEI